MLTTSQELQRKANSRPINNKCFVRNKMAQLIKKLLFEIDEAVDGKR